MNTNEDASLFPSFEIRVFISSTFKDMHNEREHLLNYVFPELRSICYRRRVTFTEIDLRWGVDEDEINNGRTVEICLQEIDHCREYPPFFIGLLGERYGWVPNKKDLKEYWSGEKPPSKYGERIGEALKEEISVTELEMRYAYFEYPKDEHVFIYFRDKNLTKELWEKAGRPHDSYYENIDLSKKLAHLKGYLKEQATYKNIEELGETIKKEFESQINRMFPLSEQKNEWETENLLHKAEVIRLSEVYVPNKLIEKVLNNYLADNEAHFSQALIGASGSGKSSILANWVKQKGVDSSQHVFSHFCGIGTVETISDWMLRVMHEIKKEYSIDKSIPTPDQLTKDEFMQWLTCVPKEQTLVLVLDAVNQLSNDELNEFIDCHELHTSLPSAVKLIWSTTDDSEVKIKEAKIKFSHLGLMGDTSAKELIKLYLSKRKKNLSDDQISGILVASNSHSPLFLKVLIEELVLTVHYTEMQGVEGKDTKELNSKIKDLAKSKEITSLFHKVIDRLNKDFSEKGHADIASHVLGLVSVSRDGLTHHDIREILGVSNVLLSALLSNLRVYFSNLNGQYALMHDALRKACASSQSENGWRKELISHFEITKQPDDKKALRETLWQHYKITAQTESEEEWWGFSKALEPLPVVCALTSDNKTGRSDLLKYAQAFYKRRANFEREKKKGIHSDKYSLFGEHSYKFPKGTVIPLSVWSRDIYLVKGERGATKIESLADFSFKYLDNIKFSERIYRHTLKIREHHLENTGAYITTLINLIKVVMLKRDALTSSNENIEDFELDAIQKQRSLLLDELDKLVSLAETVISKNGSDESLSELALFRFQLGQPEKAEQLLAKSTAKISSQVINSLAEISVYKEDYERGVKLYSKALEHNILKFGKTSVEVAITQHRLGKCLYWGNNYKEAGLYLNKALEDYITLFGDANKYVTECREDLMLILYRQRKYKEANEYLVKVFSAGQLGDELNEKRLETLARTALDICNQNNESSEQLNSRALLTAVFAKFTFCVMHDDCVEGTLEAAYQLTKKANAVNKDLRYEYGCALLSNRYFSQAEKIFQEALLLTGVEFSEERLILKLIFVKSKLKKPEEALKLYTEHFIKKQVIPRRSPERDLYVKQLHAVLCSETGRLSEAKEVFQSIHKEKQKSLSSILNTGQITFIMREFEMALTYTLERFERVKNENRLKAFESLRDLMITSYELKDFNRVKAFYDERLNYQFTDYDEKEAFDYVESEMKLILSRAQFQKGNKEDAIKSFCEARKHLIWHWSVIDCSPDEMLKEEKMFINRLEEIKEPNLRNLNKIVEIYNERLAFFHTHSIRVFLGNKGIETSAFLPYNRGDYAFFST